ncbi:MAG: selenocysteine-specific translation elongation factor [Spirochaetes bacterium]|nr:selenocysteine-specific translation elongation factor [Spirochaetota bacterium]
MHIVGTAGHVDHGKTELIKALTGVDTDRLPEEKARGMTIDLGFAHFKGDYGQLIGVIDVPGHERFIRNMAAGSWSLNCALLTVAANEGWMQQSEDHTRVLAAMDVKKIIIVITKCDLTDMAQAVLAEDDAVKRVRTITGMNPESIIVSARTGVNIDALKNLIIKTLKSVQVKSANFPCIYIDRVFTVKGTGTVITGSLTGRTIAVEDELVLLPAGKKIRIRGIQSYFKDMQKAEPVSRVALNISGLKRDELKRGDLLTSEKTQFTVEDEFIAEISRPVTSGTIRSISGPNQSLIKNHSETEIALGTGHMPALIHFIYKRQIARIVLKSPAPLLLNQPFLIIRHGGSTILGSGRVAWKGKTEKEIRKKLVEILVSMQPLTAEKNINELKLRLFGYAENTHSEGSGSVITGKWTFTEEKLREINENILKLAGSHGGITEAELKDRINIPREAFKSILGNLLTQGSLKKIRDLYTLKSLPGHNPETGLSPMAKKMLDDLKETKKGYEPKKEKIQGSQKEIRTLVRLGFVVPTEGGIYYSKESYSKLTALILEGYNPGDRFTIPEAKERTSLSRKYIIPLLNRMEKDGYVKRDGNERVVLKS